MDQTVFLAACGSYDPEEVDAAVLRCLEYFGGAASFVRPGARVVIKPNLLIPQRPESATTTHPAVLSALARAFVGAGADVLVADSPGGPYNATLLRFLYHICGLDDLDDTPGVKLNTDVSSRDVPFPDGLAVKSFPILSPVLDADIVISAAKMKTHGIAFMTGAVKNVFGVMPGLTKARMHSRFPDPADFNRMLVDLCECVKPAFSIVDGIVGMDGHGPSGGSPKTAGVLVASRNPYAADLACARIMGYSSARVPILVDAARRGLVPSDAGKLDWAGDPPERFVTFFRPATSRLPGDHLRYLPRSLRSYIHRKFAPYPAIQPSCIGCGKCVEICPRQVITLRERQAAIDYTGCIKCYCCHEICPVQAISFVLPRNRPQQGGQEGGA